MKLCFDWCFVAFGEHDKYARIISCHISVLYVCCKGSCSMNIVIVVIET